MHRMFRPTTGAALATWMLAALSPMPANAEGPTEADLAKAEQSCLKKKDGNACMLMAAAYRLDA